MPFILGSQAPFVAEEGVYRETRSSVSEWNSYFDGKETKLSAGNIHLFLMILKYLCDLLPITFNQGIIGSSSSA